MSKKPDVLVNVVKKRGEVFVWIYPDTPGKRREVCRSLGAAASDPRSLFSWYDAAQVSQAVRGGE